MKILVTGAQGFIGKNLCESLKSIRDGKDERPLVLPLLPLEVLEVGKDTPCDVFARYCEQADFVVHLAGVNRPYDPDEFVRGNLDTTQVLIDQLIQANNTPPVLLASSIWASEQAGCAQSDYGASKCAAEKALFAYGVQSGAEVMVYRLANVYGKWARPHYNSVVATFCYEIARNGEICIDDPNSLVDLCYIDDVIDEFIRALLGKSMPALCGQAAAFDESFYSVAPIDQVSVGEIARLLYRFKEAREHLTLPDCVPGSFVHKLLSTYVSYIEPRKLLYSLDIHRDNRGFFSEFMRNVPFGQIAINCSAPHKIKGNHWHHSKWEKFCVVSGLAFITLRRVGTDRKGKPYPQYSFTMCGDLPQVLEIAPGYAHNIENISRDQDLITLIWANETFDPARPDTFFWQV